MIHEILIALSGHPSPIFDERLDELPHVNAAERKLLESTGRLARLHASLRSHLHRIASCHPSMMCRAVANTILEHYLARFQDAILDVERDILTRSSKIVGAYDIVPLSSVVGRFSPWQRILEWFWDVACFMLSSESRPTSRKDLKNLKETCTGVALLARLTDDGYTGYKDIEEGSVRLVKTAERAWMRQLAVILLQGTYEESQCPDIFLARFAPEGTLPSTDLPTFVTIDTADALVNVCKILNFVEAGSSVEVGTKKGGIGAKPSVSFDVRRLLLPYIQQLSTLGDNVRPIPASQFSNVVLEMRIFLARRLSDDILPVSRLSYLLRILNSFFLCQRIEFPDALIAEADQHLHSRHAQFKLGLKGTDLIGLAGAMIKEPEVDAVFAKAWSTMASASGLFGELDADVEWARENMVLKLALADDMGNHSDGRSNTSMERFNDLVFSAPVQMSLKSSKMFSLFLTDSDMETYGLIWSYFTAIRRTHTHIKDLWRESTQRKAHPAPIGPPRSNSQRGREASQKSRRKLQMRFDKMRVPWHVCNWIVIVLNEIWEFFWGEVIHQSWDTFSDWANRDRLPDTAVTHSATLHRALDLATHPSPSVAGPQSSADRHHMVTIDYKLPHDPITLGRGHQQYLKALYASLLLDDETWRAKMRTLLTQGDSLAGKIHRLQLAQKNCDLQEEGVIENKKINHVAEETELTSALIRAAHEAKRAVSEVIKQLAKSTSRERAAFNGRAFAPGGSPVDFTPWMQSNVDRLLFKLNVQPDARD